MRSRIFLLSFLMLFLELSLIRYIPANIRLIGYFSNLVLLGSFLGIGLGLLLAPRRTNLFWLFPIFLLALVAVVLFFKVEVNVATPEVLFFRGINDQEFPLGPEILMPLVFLVVCAVFVPIAQELGKQFKGLKPLVAYSFDVLGSIAGIVVFSFFSFISAAPHVWFLVVAILGTFVYGFGGFKKLLFLAAAILVVVIVFISDGTAIWSPYYKITLFNSGDTVAINVNNTAHQYIRDWRRREVFYYAPYEVFKDKKYRKILIIGAGSGADVATALGKNPDVLLIDAVEIDPKIVEIGKELNPNKPYFDPRVHVHINDGRSFLQNSREKYDLIIYALTDSITLTSGSANIRLESFLFTRESFDLARQHLNGNGLFVLYNYYRKQWLIDKIALTLKDVFGQAPYVETYGGINRAATFMAGPKTREFSSDPTIKAHNVSSYLPVASDDWPFIYLRERGIPFYYLKFLLMIFIVSGVSIWVLGLKGKRLKIDFAMFFLGAGFFLLETKNIVTFGLLFGTTWVVNSLVFAGILGFVLLAVFLNLKFNRYPRPKGRGYLIFAQDSLHPRDKSRGFFAQNKPFGRWFYIPLFVILALNFLIPPQWFLNFSPFWRFLFSAVFYLSPVFCASMIFSSRFKKTDSAATALGWNILGLMFGGLAEYAALAIGYGYLTLVIAAFYLLSIWGSRR